LCFTNFKLYAVIIIVSLYSHKVNCNDTEIPWCVSAMIQRFLDVSECHNIYTVEFSAMIQRFIDVSECHNIYTVEFSFLEGSSYIKESLYHCTDTSRNLCIIAIYFVRIKTYNNNNSIQFKICKTFTNIDKQNYVKANTCNI
jgi:hypothetical protein